MTSALFILLGIITGGFVITLVLYYLWKCIIKDILNHFTIN